MRKVIEVKTLPADHSPESIANITCIVTIVGDRGKGHIDTESFSLDGTVEEKLAQYKEATGRDWSGYPERTFTVYDNTPPMSLMMGAKHAGLVKKPQIDIDVQDAIDELSERAQALLDENEVGKQEWVTKKEVEALTV